MKLDNTFKRERIHFKKQRNKRKKKRKQIMKEINIKNDSWPKSTG